VCGQACVHVLCKHECLSVGTSICLSCAGKEYQYYYVCNKACVLGASSLVLIVLSAFVQVFVLLHHKRGRTLLPSLLSAAPFVLRCTSLLRPVVSVDIGMCCAACCTWQACALRELAQQAAPTLTRRCCASSCLDPGAPPGCCHGVHTNLCATCEWCLLPTSCE
jgi:hypothetical protein